MEDSDIRNLLETMTVEEIEEVQLFIQQLLAKQKTAAE